MYSLTLPGVLQKPNEAPNHQGIALYRALAAIGRVSVLGGLDPERDDWFLRTNGLTQHIHLIPEDIADAPSEVGRRLSQIHRLRAFGHIEFAIDADPAVVAAFYADSVPALLYLHPQFSQPSFRPDYRSKAKPWDVLVAAVDYQIAVKAQATRPEDLQEDED